LIGWILFGWGAFNLAEGLVNHQILGLHHVREGAGHQTAYDLGFLAFGALLLIVGWRFHTRQLAPNRPLAQPRHASIAFHCRTGQTTALLLERVKTLARTLERAIRRRT
jgi:Predicted membrane protein (DUF2243)